MVSSRDDCANAKRKILFLRRGLPPQTQLITDRAVFSEAYAVIPKGTLRDIVTSCIPFWNGARFWILSRPLSGFAETFSQYIAEVQPSGGSHRPETEPGVESAIFVVSGGISLLNNGTHHTLTEGGFVYLPPDADQQISNPKEAPVRFHWIRKTYQAVVGLDVPDAIVANENEIDPTPMPGTDGKWVTTRFMDPENLRHGMHVTIVTFQSGAAIKSSCKYFQ